MTNDPDSLVTIGNLWFAVLGWRRTYPDRPFVGIRVDHDEVWVACEAKIAGRPIPTEALAELQSLFEQAGRGAWVDADVLLFHAASLREAHRVTRRAVTILRSHGLRP